MTNRLQMKLVSMKNNFRIPIKAEIWRSTWFHFRSTRVDREQTRRVRDFRHPLPRQTGQFSPQTHRGFWVAEVVSGRLTSAQPFQELSLCSSFATLFPAFFTMVNGSEYAATSLGGPSLFHQIINQIMHECTFYHPLLLEQNNTTLWNVSCAHCK